MHSRRVGGGWGASALLVVAMSSGCGDDAVGTSDSASSSGGETTTATTTSTSTTGATATTTSATGTASDSESTSTSTTTTTTGPTPVCGDGAVDPGEECDDGPGNGPGAACKADCTANVCGDGDQGPGEECDNGAQNADDAACTVACKDAACGDGLVGPGEGCDDGNQVDDDTCTNACKLPSCGDGVLNMGEACDDGNADDTDACTSNCTAATCGDGFVQGGVGEGCDLGVDNSDQGACTLACQAAVCGDGLVYSEGEGTEACDDGNDVDDDDCSNSCVAAACDDMAKNGGESDVDCGGACEPCGVGQGCAGDGDCAPNKCDGGVCYYPASCAEVLALDPGAQSGTTMIDPDGQAGEAPFTARCDMETDGGGWTLIGSQVNGDGRKWNSLAVHTDVTAFGDVDNYTGADYKNVGWTTLAAKNLLVRTDEYAVAWTADLLGDATFGAWIAANYNMNQCSQSFLGGTPAYSEGLTEAQRGLFDIVVRALDSNCSCFPGCNENALVTFALPTCCWTSGLGNTPMGQGTWSSHDHSFVKLSMLNPQPCNPATYPCNPAGSWIANGLCYDTSCKSPYVGVWVR